LRGPVSLASRERTRRSGSEPAQPIERTQLKIVRRYNFFGCEKVG
jgi:hypothetical protein